MPLALQLVAALALDFLLGDPRWLPHPVRLIGRLAQGLEAPLRRTIGNDRLAGVVMVATVLAVTVGVTVAVLAAASSVHPWLGDVVSVLILWTTLAWRDLGRHSRAVWKALAANDLPRARRRVGWLVGRDTANLNEEGVVRATVESVAENTVDGVTAPLVFAVAGGPVGAMVYKAINTLDSTFGYRNDQYIQFGWASARLDDLANWLPARLTGALIVLSAAVLRLSPSRALAIMVRDHGRHPSPNAGWTEAAMAGALGVRLGGASTYGGVGSVKPSLGDGAERLVASHILAANRLMSVTVALAAVFLLAAHRFFVGFS